MVKDEVTPAAAGINAKTIGVAPLRPMDEINKRFFQLAFGKKR